MQPTKGDRQMRSVSRLRAFFALTLAACGGYASSGPNPNAVPVAVQIYTGDGQSGPKGSTLRDPLCTYVLDAAGKQLVGITVTYTVTTGGGQMQAPGTAPTDGYGISTSGSWTLGGTSGTQTVVASVLGATPVTFTATAQ